MKIQLLIFFFLIIESYQKSKVYFTKEISSEKVVEIFKKLNVELTGNVALKVHSGENQGKYFLKPDFLQPIYDETKGTFVECNTAYDKLTETFPARRYETSKHKELLKEHGWLDNNRRFVIMDEDPTKDEEITIENPAMIGKNYVGEHLKEFDSCLVLSHLKGHGMGGFGGALKQLSIGFASQAGKTWIHTAGKTKEWREMDANLANQENFTAAMGDAASSIVNYFREKGQIAFINVIANISLYCDCAGGLAPEPKIHDIGILASTDPVALDRASVDLVKNTSDVGTQKWIEQLENLKGENTIAIAEKHGIGTQDYDLISIDQKKSDVYFTKTISSEAVVEMFRRLNVKLEGKVALKVHSGENQGKYFLKPNFLLPIYDETNGTFVECNTAYDKLTETFPARRYETSKHKELLKEHGWLDNNRRFVIMDEDPTKDVELTIENPAMIGKNYVGEHLNEFDSCLVLSHLKGHPMGGFGGALKQLSIGFASQAGKTWIHTAGKTKEWREMDANLANQENFTAAMGDAASSIVNYFRKKGQIAFINVIANISLYCDCAGGLAPVPKIHDIGILASTDPVALDRASIDLIKKTTDEGTGEWIKQLDDLKGENTIAVAEKHGIGTQDYNLINVELKESDVYFTKTISPEAMVEMFNQLNIELKGNVALKVHSGENGGKYFLTPNFLQPIYDKTNGTFVECNTAYDKMRDVEARRYETSKHKELLKEHGWLDNNRRFVIMDEDPTKDEEITIENPEMIKTNYVGQHLKDFDSCLVLSHLKGHGMGGFGGALKQLSIGFASQAGKTWIHTAGKTKDWKIMHENYANQENFTAAMGDASSSIVNYFRKKGQIAFINVIANISLYCDCAGLLAPEPKIRDIGILASTDPVALDRASVYLVKTTVENGTIEWIEQLEKLKGDNTISVAEKHGIGTHLYKLIEVNIPSKEDTSTGEIPPDPKDEPSYLWILFVVIGIVALVGIVLGVIIYKKRKLRLSNINNGERLVSESKEE